jgi:uncharacterized membrane protein YkvA (DUF1232 family)
METKTGDSVDISMWNRLKTWARRMKRDTLALYLASRDPRVPWHAKTMAMVTAAYALSPIDLIPDFIPVLGYLDELIILPLFIYLTIRLIPPDIIVELRAQADQHLSENRPRSMTGAVVIILIWLSIFALVVYWLIK